MLESTTRRRALIGLGAATSPFVLPRSLVGATLGESPFTLGVAAGEPWPDGFVIWTRLAPDPLAPDGSGGLSAPVAVLWEVFSDEGLKSLAASGRVQADGRFAHAVHVEVEGLAPGRPYWYRFTALGQQSPVGAAKTAPRPGDSLAQLTLTAASCAHYEVGWFSAYRHMAAEAPDLALFLGDYIYEYSYRPTRTDLVRRHEIATDIVTLAQYRNRYACVKRDPDLQAVHHASACLVTWDDHEVHNDYAARWSAYPGWTEEAFMQRRRAAYQAFYEHMPLRRRSLPQGDGLRLYDRFRFGDLAEINVLDGRQYKSEHGCQTPTIRRGHVAPLDCPDMIDPTRSFLGRDQEAWLYDGFRRASTRWNIIAQQTQFSPYVQNGSDGVVGEYTENWATQGLSRQRLIEAMTGSNLSNPLILGGDIHAFLAADIKADFKDPESRALASEFVGASITSDQMPDSFLDTLPLNPHVKFCATRSRGYFHVRLEPGAAHTRFRAISDRADPNATVSTLKAFVVEDGRPGLQIV